MLRGLLACCSGMGASFFSSSTSSLPLLSPFFLLSVLVFYKVKEMGEWRGLMYVREDGLMCGARVCV
jgi:hypothetical protein